MLIHFIIYILFYQDCSSEITTEEIMNKEEKEKINKCLIIEYYIYFININF